MINQQFIVESYFNTGRTSPVVLSAEEPSVGLSDIKIVFNQGYLFCSFKRMKQNSISERYFDLNKPYHIQLAKGNFTSTCLFKNKNN